MLILSLTCYCLELEACTKANEELQKLREVAEAREAATEEKLRLEQQASRGTIRKSYCYVLSVISPAWADPAGCFSAQAENQAAQATGGAAWGFRARGRCGGQEPV